MPLIGAEAVAASTLAFLTTAIASAYLSDTIGSAIHPLPILLLSAASAAGAWVVLRTQATRDAPALAAFAGCVLATFAWFLWRARPDFLPTGSGPDLAHHLSLVDYIERHWRLPHDVSLYEYLGEMVDYTPGSHLLAALAGAWVRGAALHAVYPVVAGTVALKAGFVFLIARRMIPDQAPRLPFAVIAVVLLFLARVHFAGSFTEQSYLAQVVSELFAVAMWWAASVWDQRPSVAAALWFGIAGVAAFLSWPVWVGPPMVTLAALALVHGELPLLARARHLAIAFAPIAIVAAIHGSRHTSGFKMAGTGGFAIWPTPALLGWWFVGLAAVGLVGGVANRRAWPIAILAAAIALQAAALYGTAQSSGALVPYLALKMFYLAVYPLMAGAAVAIGSLWCAVARPARLRGARGERLAWVLTAVIAIAVGRPLLAAPRPRPVVTEAVFEAATWARTQAAPECIDYLTSDLYTAYWLHLAVFNQPRASGRAMNDDTFDTRKSRERWILSSGLPLGVTDDFEALPRDIRTSVDVVRRFGPAAVVRRRGPSSCAH